MLGSFPLRPHAPDNLPRPEHWSARAACRDADPALFFPEDHGSAMAPLIAEQAKSYCRRCPSRQPCLADALHRKEAHGVWGGMDEHERRALFQQHRLKAAQAAQEREREEGADRGTEQPVPAP